MPWNGSWSGLVSIPQPSGGPCVPALDYHFDGPVDATSLTITARDLGAGVDITGFLSYDPTTYRATFTPVGTPFLCGEVYQATVLAAAPDGTPMDAPDTFLFIPSADQTGPVDGSLVVSGLGQILPFPPDGLLVSRSPVVSGLGQVLPF